MVNKVLISLASEKGHFNGLVDEGKYLRQSSLYKQILPRTPNRQKNSMISVNPVILSNFSSFLLCLFVAKNQRNQRNPLLMKYLCADKALYKCRDIFTVVMSALQIHPFLTNKPNFRKSQVNVNKVLTKDYEQLDTWWSGKNKPNSNPIQTQFKPN
ncbi:MAG: hypothetical protein WBC22_03810 [Sedimentisphaerales bacterium]